MAGFPSGWGSFGPGYNTSDCNLDVIGREEQLEIQIGAMFNMYDVTGSGLIGQESMRRMLTDIGRIHADDGDAEDIVRGEIAKADFNQDGGLHFAEFVAYFTTCARLPSSDGGGGGGEEHHRTRTTDFMAAPAHNQVDSLGRGGGGDGGSRAEREYEASLLRWVQGLTHEATGADYSRGLAGTMEDSLLERSVASALRGGDVAAANEGAFSTQPCHCTMTPLGEHGNDCAGKWLRATNQQSGCALYVHTITHVVTAKRPAEFYDPEEEKRKALLAAAGEFPDFPACLLEHLEATAADVHAREHKTVLLLTGSDAMHAEALAWFAEETGEQDKAHSPLRRGEVVDTRPFVRGHLSTGVTLDQAARTAKSKLIRAVKYGGLAVIDVQDEPPDFAAKVCKKYHEALPIQLFNPKAQGWKKDLLRGGAVHPSSRVLVVASADPGNYQRLLKDKLDPDPWRYLYPVHLKSTPVEVIALRSLVDSISSSTHQGRVPLLLDCTARKGTVDTFFLYQRAFVIDVKTDVLSRLSLLAHDPGNLTPAELEVVDGWRRKLVQAMKQGYYLVLALGDSCFDFLSDYSHDEYLPSVVLKCGEIQKQKWLDLVVREEDKVRSRI
mmetsp:Transcript_37659/g.70659  ORF Transcript_37659/g.70659 Transcript_37659/m.70659 type:complete len:610 (+) Transcript_37659:1091-2920(+)